MASQTMCKACYLDFLRREKVDLFDGLYDPEYAFCKTCGEKRHRHQFVRCEDGISADTNRPCKFCRKEQKKKTPRKRCIHCKIYKNQKQVSSNGVCERCRKLPFACLSCNQSHPGREFLNLETKLCIYCVLKRNKRSDIVLLRELMRNDEDIAASLEKWILQHHDELIIKEE